MMRSGLLDTDDRLLPCPFCGSVAGFRESEKFTEWPIRAECSNSQCAVMQPYHYKTREEAIKWWNQRVTTP